MRRLSLLLALLAAPIPAVAQRCAGATPGALALLATGRVASLVVDPAEEPGVRRAAIDLGADLKAVGGGDTRIASDASGGATVSDDAGGDGRRAGRRSSSVRRKRRRSAR